ncbi:MAG: thermonuclease family protein [Thiobacillus sp.]
MRWFRLCLVCLAWAAAPAAAETMHGVVIVVIDGDTVLFKPDHARAGSRAFQKIRLADIDAPEQNQPHGDAATRVLTELVLKKRVEIDTVATDGYGRKVAQIQVGALQVNTELVRRGAAWASTRHRRKPALTAAQHEARHARLGLWAETDPTPPWVWRRTQSSPAF